MCELEHRQAPPSSRSPSCEPRGATCRRAAVLVASRRSCEHRLALGFQHGLPLGVGGATKSDRRPTELRRPPGRAAPRPAKDWNRDQSGKRQRIVHVGGSKPPAAITASTTSAGSTATVSTRERMSRSTLNPRTDPSRSRRARKAGQLTTLSLRASRKASRTWADRVRPPVRPRSKSARQRGSAVHGAVRARHRCERRTGSLHVDDRRRPKR